MLRRSLLLPLTTVLIFGLVSPLSAATTLKKLNMSPFYSQGVKSEADVRAMVKARAADLEAGFAKAGAPDLYPAFMEQFPAAKLTLVKVAPGETFQWMLFKKKKGRGQVAVLTDVTWKGAAPFDAYRFEIDKGGKRNEFLVPIVCGNIALKSVAMIPVPAPAAAPPPPPPPPPVAAPAPPPPPAPVAAPAPPPPPPPKAAAPPPVAAPAPPPPPPPAPPPPPPVAAPAPPPPAPVAAPAPAPAAKRLGGPLVDVGLARQPDPANYLVLRLGYEWPLAEKLYLIGLVGGSLRWMGHDGGSAFTADVMLDYHWVDKFSFGLGAGYWSGNDGQVDLIANAGYLVWGTPDGRNTELFLEARLPADELGDSDELGRFGLGLRFRF